MSAVNVLRPEQRTASDTRASIWVTANAGSGKTFVLASRVLRLLLDGNDPDTLLCLTFTKAAAAEMANRVIDTLRLWATIDDTHLADHLFALEGTRPSHETMMRARSLFALALETPGGLKIQTIHAFCESVLARFPFEAGVTPDPAILDERRAGDLLATSRQAVLTEAVLEPDAPIATALGELITLVEDGGLSDLIDAGLARRSALRAWIAEAGDFERAMDSLCDRMGLDPDDSEERMAARVEAAFADVDRDAPAFLETLSAGAKTDQAVSKRLAAALAASATTDERLALVLTGGGTIRARSRFVTKGWREENPALSDRLDVLLDDLTALHDLRNALREWTLTRALFVITFAVLERFETAKTARGALDFEDLIERTANLLTREGGAAWVLYKLDQGIDHILVDEAQDTSAAQWRIIQAIAEEFYSGHSARRANRTVFVVGDEKQSIYSFQGADPAVFSAMQRAFRSRIDAADQTFERVPLVTSFRTVPSVLSVVDTVFDADARHRGVIAEGDVWPGHTPARRAEDGGLVELWPIIEPEDEPEAMAWNAPLDMPKQSDPKAQNAERIAAVVSKLLADGDATGPNREPLTPGDILILVRKRQTFAEAINRALKYRAIPVIGADRLRLGEHIAVMDLVALATFVLLPEDDLTLAALLKSPLCGLDDDDLIAIAPGREGTLWDALRSSSVDRHRMVAERLSGWLALADQVPPFRFFAEVLSTGGGRRAFRSRLGAEVDDILDEFVALALRFEQDETPTLQSFLDHLSAADVVVKRDMDQAGDKVRVMTVHGAKGLEARVVILADAGGKTDGGADPKLLPVPDDVPAPPYLWVRGAGVRSTLGEAAKEAQAMRREAEDRRLLYVALTRACDRLYIAGHGNRSSKGKGAPDGSWHAIIDSALEGQWVRVPDPYGLGFDVKRVGTPTGGIETPRDTPERALNSPRWLDAPVPPEPRSARLAAPASAWLAPVTGEAVDAGPLSKIDGSSAAEKGRLIHTLLQWLPSRPRDGWDDAIRALVARRDVSPETEAAIRHDVLAVLADDRLQPVFTDQARPEVPLIGVITRPDGEAVEVSGIIDRLAVTDSSVSLVDFKTGSLVPGSLAEAPKSHVDQMRAYRALLAGIYPDHAIDAALVYTAGPVIFSVS